MGRRQGCVMLSGPKERKRYIRKKATELGIFKEAPDAAKRRGDLLKSISDSLRSNGWTARQAQDAIEAWKRTGISMRKLHAISKLGLDHDDTFRFMESYRALGDIAIGAAFSRKAPVRMLVNMLHRLGDIDKLEDFMEFCKDRVEEDGTPHHAQDGHVFMARMLMEYASTNEGTTASESMALMKDGALKDAERGSAPERKDAPDAVGSVVRDADRRQMDRLRIS